MSEEPSCPNCSMCALKSYHDKRDSYSPVPPEINAHGLPLVVLPAPEVRDSQVQVPLMGRYAPDVVEVLDAQFGRDDINVGHAVACPYPQDDRGQFLRAMKRENKKRLARGAPPLLDPVVACRPWLDGMLDAEPPLLITMGKEPLQWALGKVAVVDDYRGTPHTTPSGRRLLATFAPRRIHFERRYLETFRRDISKAKRYRDDQLNWDEVQVERNPSVERITEFLLQAKTLTWDLETDGIDALAINIRCIGLYYDNQSIVIHFKSCVADRKNEPVPVIELNAPFPVDPEYFPYTMAEYREILSMLDAVMRDENIEKIGHNSGYFDALVWWQKFGYFPGPQYDTILAHHLADNELLHRLQFVTSYYLDPPPWKSEHTAITARTDADLGEYCALDVAGTGRIVPYLRKEISTKRQGRIYQQSERLQEIARGMRIIGMRFNEQRRLEHLENYTAKRDVARGVLDEIASVNPRSPDQLRRLVFEEWGLPWQDITDSGLPSTGAASVRQLLMSGTCSEEQSTYLKHLLRYRKADKVITTYLNAYAPDSEKNLVRHGRVHSDYNTTGTLGGRYSSENPNGQNFPYLLRDMFVPDDGYAFVYADMDQLEMRLAAALASCRLYLDAFLGGPIEPHGVTAQMMLGDRYWTLEGAPVEGNRRDKGKDGTAFARARGACKNVYYGAQYGAGIHTLMQQLAKIEDRNGEMVFADWTEQKVKVLVNRWKKAAPEYVRWWRGLMDQARNQGYIQEPVWGRRYYLKNGIKLNDVANFPCQSGGFAITALGMFDILRQIPFDYDKRIGFVNQSHDSVLLHVPQDMADEALSIVESSLCRRIQGLDVEFTAESKIYKTAGG